MAGTIPSFIAPSSKTWLGLARELYTGTPVGPTNTVPLDKNSYQPEDTPKFLPDESIRGVMAQLYNDILGVEDATFSFGGPMFFDVGGFWIDNAFGDLSTTGTSAASTTTVNTLGTIGATQLVLASGGGYSSASSVQIDTGSVSEVVVLSSPPAGGTITFANDPLRFAHGTGVAASVVVGPYCVDAETEILTGDGWKEVYNLRAGEEVLTYNHVTGMSEWQPALEVCVFPAEERELISMEARGHSSLTTPNHRWPVVTHAGQRVWRTTETLRGHDRFPAGAMCGDLPQEAKYTDAFVELVAWFWTEGTVIGVNGIRICQSAQKNADNVDRIDATLRGVFGPPSEKLGKLDPEPKWRRYLDADGRNTRFVLNAAAGKQVQSAAPARVVRRDFLRTLTQAQLDLFIKVSMLADNCGPTRLAQKNRDAAEAFQFAATLAGYPTSLLERVYKRDGLRMWGVTLQNRKWIAPADGARVNAARQGAPGPTGWRIERVTHDGIVWCPRTANMTWYARRHGMCYFTGNTHTFAILNTGSGQPPTHSLTDFTNLTASTGARTYPSACVSQLDFTGNAESLLMQKVSGNSWLSAAAAQTPVNTTAFTIPQANWQSTVTVGGTQVYNVGEWGIAIKRMLQIYWTAQNSQQPFIIARGGLGITGTLNYTVAMNEQPLLNMLTSGPQAVAITLSNGLTSINKLSITITTTKAQFVKAKVDRNAVLVGYSDEWEATANTTDVGGSGGIGPGTIQLINNIPTY